jgi:CheY-like chemotaxis protein
MTTSRAEIASHRFDGLKVLVVEDQAVIFFMIRDMLKELGCVAIWHARDVREGLELLREERPDVAVLDVNLAGEFVYPIAAQLDATQIPFLFATGYGRKGMPERWANSPVIQKPFLAETLGAALNSVLRNLP